MAYTYEFAKYEQAKEIVQRQLRIRSQELNRSVRRGLLKKTFRLVLKGSNGILHRPYGWVFFCEIQPLPEEKERKSILPYLKPFLVLRESGKLIMLGVEHSIEDDLVDYDVNYGGGKFEITYSEAMQIAQSYLGGRKVRPLDEIQLPYGWVFIEHWKDPEQSPPPGLAPYLVLRRGGMIVFFGSYAPIEKQLREYEQLLYGFG